MSVSQTIWILKWILDGLDHRRIGISKKCISSRFIEFYEKLGYIGEVFDQVEYALSVSQASWQQVKSRSKLIFGSACAESILEMLDLWFQMAPNR